MEAKILVVTITLSLLLSGLLVAVRGETTGEEEIAVPEWNEGDKWRYSYNGQTIIEREVTDKNVEINASWANEDKKIYETYEVRETHNPDNSADRWEADVYYSNDSLAEVYRSPVEEGEVDSAYHPPIIELDFPLYVGKVWSTDSGYDNQYDTAKYFEDPPDPEDGENPEPDREYAFVGQVENKTTRRVNLEKGTKEFETYMVNLTILSYDYEQNKTQLNRYEMYYSPEVKNLVHTDIFEFRRMPEGQNVGDNTDIRRELVSNITLQEYDIEIVEEEQEHNSSLLADYCWLIMIFMIIAVIVIGIAIAWSKKKPPVQQLSQQRQPPPQQQPSEQKTLRKKLEALHEKKDKNLISEEEFERKKDEILDNY